MTKLITIFMTVAAVAGAASAFVQIENLPRSGRQEPGKSAHPQTEGFNLDGSWVLIWEENADGEMSSNPRKEEVALEQVGSNIIGKFVAGDRKAIFTGELFSGESNLLLLVQRERDLTRVYQVQLGVLTDQGPRGNWNDTSGAMGEFWMLKVQ